MENYRFNLIGKLKMALILYIFYLILIILDDIHYQSTEIILFHYRYLPKYLVIITTCNSNHTVKELLTKNNISNIELECNHATKFYDCVQTIRLLEFFVDHYYNDLASTYVITDDHVKHWHHENILKGILNAIKHNYFDTYDYNGYFDYWNEENFTKNSTWDLQFPPNSFYELMDYFYNDTNVDWKGYNSYPACTTFFVKSNLIRSRSIDFYKKLISKGRKWSKKHSNWKPNPGFYCGRVFEYSFHLIFKKNKTVEMPPVFYI